MSASFPNNNPIIRLDLKHSILDMVINNCKFMHSKLICEIKKSIVSRFGTEAEFMKLQLWDSSEQFICEMNDDSKSLACYGPEEGYIIYVIDTDPNSILTQIKDLGQVEKYMMSDAKYDELPHSMRKYLKNLRENNPELFEYDQLNNDQDFMKDIAEQYNVGDRCLWISEQIKGEIAYIGKIEGSGKGYYLGVHLDHPLGINDGSFKGESYFKVKKKHGVFLRPDKVYVGDYPKDESDDSDIDEI